MRSFSRSDPDPGLERATASLRGISRPARKILSWSRYLFMPLALGFILYVSWSSRDLLRAVLEEATVWGLIAAVALWSFFHLTVPTFDLLILKGFDTDTQYPTLWRIYLTRLPTKYLPGGIWHNVTRLVDLHRVSVPRPYLTTLAILQISIPACVAFLLGGSLVYLDQGTSRWGLIGVVAAAASGVVLLATPYVLNSSLLREHGRVPTTSYAGAVMMAAVTWGVAGGAFYTYISAYPILTPDSSLSNAIGAYLMAWGTGFISIFTPQGLGVFEATAANLIRSTVEFQVTVAIVAGFRVVILMSDVLAWLTFQGATRFWPARRG